MDISGLVNVSDGGCRLCVHQILLVAVLIPVVTPVAGKATPTTLMSVIDNSWLCTNIVDTLVFTRTITSPVVYPKTQYSDVLQRAIEGLLSKKDDRCFLDLPYSRVTNCTSCKNSLFYRGTRNHVLNALGIKVRDKNRASQRQKQLQPIFKTKTLRRNE